MFYAFALSGRWWFIVCYPGCRFACPGLRAYWAFSPFLSESEAPVCCFLVSGCLRDSFGMGLHLEAMGAHRQSNCRFCCCSCVTVDRLIRICYIRIFIVNFFMNFIVNFIMNSVQFFSLMTFFTSGISLMGATMFLQNYLSLPAKVR